MYSRPDIFFQDYILEGEKISTFHHGILAVAVVVWPFFPTLHGMWDLSSPTRDRTRNPCSGSKGALTTEPATGEASPFVVF